MEKSRSFVGELTEQHRRLLYLIHLYSHPASSGREKEVWIRRIPLLVLIYEGVVKKALDYDYAPRSVVIGKRRIYLNISQEGRDDIDDLREMGFVRGLKLSTAQYQSVTAFQASPEGLGVIGSLSEEDRAAIEGFARCPKCDALLSVVLEGEEFFLVCPAGDFREKSGITDIEDVSYVSSPYLPDHVRSSREPFRSFRHRVSELTGGGTTIRDDLEELIVLSEVRLLVGEWVPFGSNQIVALNDRLGSPERVKGGLFTQLVDDHPTDTQFSIEPGMTEVHVVDFDLTSHVNFEAEINYPEEEGIIQVENFGVHIRHDGLCMYGLEIDGICDRASDHVSLDHLSRLLADIHQDSSQIMSSLLSAYQRSLLDLTFYGASGNRDKFNIILAEKITPHMTADRYMDKESFENELKQVLGDTQSAHDLGSGEILIQGRHGLIFAGASPHAHEALLVDFLGLKGLEIFLNNFFMRSFVLADALKEIRRLIEESEKDPNSIPRARSLLSECSRDAVSMREILAYMSEAHEVWKRRIEREEKRSRADRRLAGLLGLENLLTNCEFRIKDMEKIIEGIDNELVGLRDMTDVISEQQMFRMQEALQSNTRNLEDVTRSGERTGATLKVVEIILAGTLAFDIMDRFTGEWTLMNSPWAKNHIAWIEEEPFAWFAIALLLWVLIAVGLIKFMGWLERRAAPVLVSRLKINRRCDLAKLQAFLSEKRIMTQDNELFAKSHLRKVSWEEPDSLVWGGYCPKVELSYDERNGYILNAFLEVENPGRLRESELNEVFFRELKQRGVFAS
jgi:WD repeat-containing protein 35